MNDLKRVYIRLRREADAAWESQLALCDHLERAGETDYEAMRAAIRLAQQAEEAAHVAYTDWQDHYVTQ